MNCIKISYDLSICISKRFYSIANSNINIKNKGYNILSKYNDSLFANIQLYFFKISDYLTSHGYRHEILSSCILNSLNFNLWQNPLLICPFVDIISLNKTPIQLYYIKPIIDRLNQCYSYTNPIKHITNLLLCEVSRGDLSANSLELVDSNSNFKGFKDLLFKALLPENIYNQIEFYNIFWILKNNPPFWLSDFRSDEWFNDVVKLFDLYKGDLSIEINESEVIEEIRNVLDMLKITHQRIISQQCYIPIHIENTNLTIHYPRYCDLYYGTEEYVTRYQLYLDILRKQGWEPVSISPIEWNRISIEGIDACKTYIKKILLNYYKKFIIP